MTILRSPGTCFTSLRHLTAVAESRRVDIHKLDEVLEDKFGSREAAKSEAARIIVSWARYRLLALLTVTLALSVAT